MVAVVVVVVVVVVVWSSLVVVVVLAVVVVVVEAGGVAPLPPASRRCWGFFAPMDMDMDMDMDSAIGERPRNVLSETQTPPYDWRLGRSLSL